ncbi:MAG: Rpn family recombination-promoting nuclease/putative transposase [Tannerella sp.]|jgi:predicted transposase/invertase (TIGR01784 family)|nr:Rpn family recombination-promoting nuclease/putative transposase [Tannerella sp.]
MAIRRKETNKKTSTVPEPEPVGWGKRARYINPHTDFGFKKLFGTEANKDVLQALLPVLLRKSDRIEKLSYMQPGQLGRSEADRDAVYDIYCETEKGEKFIVEMQRTYQEFFIDRSVYYATFPIQEQAKKGANWNFRLNSIYTIGILNFEFKDGERGWKEYPYLHHVQLSDTETKSVFYDKLTFVYLELPRFNKTEDELETLLDKWMYVFKNLAKLDERPKVLRERVFRRLFRIAEMEQLSEMERLAYHESQKHYWDYMNTVQSAEKKGAEQAAKEKDAIIREKEETIREKEEVIRKKENVIRENEKTILELLKREEAIAGNLLKNGVSPEIVSVSTGLNIHRVNEILELLNH